MRKHESVKTEPKFQPEPKAIKFVGSKASEVVLKAMSELDVEVAREILAMVNCDEDPMARAILNLGALELCRLYLTKKYGTTFCLAVGKMVVLTNIKD